MQEYVNINDPEGWQEGKELRQKGLHLKNLLEEKSKRTVVLKLPPGFRMVSHKHNFPEQQLLLEGEFSSGDRTFTTGTYLCVPPDTEHGPYYSEKGAVILVIWDQIPE